MLQSDDDDEVSEVVVGGDVATCVTTALFTVIDAKLSVVCNNEEDVVASCCSRVAKFNAEGDVDEPAMTRNTLPVAVPVGDEPDVDDMEYEAVMIVCDTDRSTATAFVITNMPLELNREEGIDTDRVTIYDGGGVVGDDDVGDDADAATVVVAVDDDEDDGEEEAKIDGVFGDGVVNVADADVGMMEAGVVDAVTCDVVATVIDGAIDVVGMLAVTAVVVVVVDADGVSECVVPDGELLVVVVVVAAVVVAGDVVRVVGEAVGVDDED